MRKSIALILLFVSMAGMAGDNFGLKFDSNTGLLIKPDEYYLSKAIADENKGRTKSALKNFKKSAEYGNMVAMSMISWNHLNNKKYIESMAWLQLTDIDKLPDNEYAVKMSSMLNEFLTPEEVKSVNKLHAELQETYGQEATLMKRVKWMNNIKVTGSRTKGRIPNSASFYLNGGRIVGGSNARGQAEDFVQNYKFSDQIGHVSLGDLETNDE